MGIMSGLEVLVWIVVLFILFGLRYFDFGTAGGVETIPREHKILVVYSPALGGRASRPDLEKLVREAYPSADVLIPTYSHGWASNIDPYDITQTIETAIDRAHNTHDYEKIILFGYSTGGLLLRK